MSRPAPALLLLLLAGCFNPFYTREDGSAATPPISVKVIASKRAPNVLVATDGYTCVTTAGRWEKARPGDRFTCAWQERF